MNKAIYLVAILTLSLTNAFSQKVDKFCEVVLKEQTFSRNYKVDRIEYGKSSQATPFKDAAVALTLDSLLNFPPFRSPIGVIEYMSRNHWTLITSYTGIRNSSSNTTLPHLIFKREFDGSEILQ